MAGHQAWRPETAAVATGRDPSPGASLIWLESPTNPMLGVADLPRILRAANRAGVPAVVDNTFATPSSSSLSP